MSESKTCAECGTQFHRPHGRSAKQWAKMRSCSPRCANIIRARGRDRQSGDLDRSQGKVAYQRAWQHRRWMPQWADMWEEHRAREERALDRALAVRQAKRQRRIDRATRPLAPPRQFIAGRCPDCDMSVVVIRGWWNDSIRCPRCTKARWRETHRTRALRYGVQFDVIANVQVFKRDGYRCGICRRLTKGAWPHPRSPTLDHIVPMAAGGAHVMENLQCACLACNVSKGARSANDQLRLAV